MITKTYNKHIAKTKKQNKTATIGLMEEGNEKNHTSFNKYACACAIVASMISFIFGYGRFNLNPIIWSVYDKYLRYGHNSILSLFNPKFLRTIIYIFFKNPFMLSVRF